MVRSAWLFSLVLVSLGCLIFVVDAPLSVQELDCGELVASTYLWRHLHAPGYPLYEIVYWLALHGLPFSSIVARASALTIALGLLTLWVLHQFLLRKGSHFAAWILPFLLLAWPPFFKYMLMPDVFMLHLLISSLFLALYLSNESWRNRVLGMSFLFALGLVHHHTIVFLSPLLLHAILEYLREGGNFRFLSKIAAGGFLFVLAFYLLLFTNSEAGPYAPAIKTSGDLIAHILRFQYGTFNLRPSGSGTFYLAILWVYWQTSVLLWAAFLGMVWVAKNVRWDLRALFLGCVLFFYISVFFGLSKNVEPIAAGEEVLTRFFLLPGIVLIYLGAYLLTLRTEARAWRPILQVGVCCLVLCGIGSNLYRLDFRNNRVLEDWARDRLESVPESSSKRTVVLQSGDSPLFALYYVQEVLGIRKDLVVVSPAMLLAPWYSIKIEKALPGFKIFPKRDGDVVLEDDLIEPNISQFNFNMHTDFNDSVNFKVTFLKVGRQIEEGSGLFYALHNDRYPVLGAIPAEGLFSKLKLWHVVDLYENYAHYYLAQGLERYRQHDLYAALGFFQLAKAVVPFSYPAQYNICKVLVGLSHPDAGPCMSDLRFMEMERLTGS